MINPPGMRTPAVADPPAADASGTKLRGLPLLQRLPQMSDERLLKLQQSATRITMDAEHPKHARATIALPLIDADLAFDPHWIDAGSSQWLFDDLRALSEFDHPLLSNLRQPRVITGRLRNPSYVAPQTFSLAVLSILAPERQPPAEPAGQIGLSGRQVGFRCGRCHGPRNFPDDQASRRPAQCTDSTSAPPSQ